MIYNASFWASYNYFEKWKVYHYSPFAFSIITATIFNAICIVLILNWSSKRTLQKFQFSYYSLFFCYNLSLNKNIAYLWLMLLSKIWFVFLGSILYKITYFCEDVNLKFVQIFKTKSFFRYFNTTNFGN